MIKNRHENKKKRHEQMDEIKNKKEAKRKMKEKGMRKLIEEREE